MAEQENLDLFSAEESYIVGQTVAIFYQNPTNFYKVLLIRVTETNTNYDDKEIVITGSFGQVQEEETYRFYGKIADHPKFGVQFNAHRYKQEKPTSLIGVVNYLSSDKFPGIGKKTAENIVKVLGEEAIDRISDNPTVLEEVAGLNDKKKSVLVQTIQASDGMEKIIIGLNSY
jgi:exodeoxyribonuclease V alpha subunit